MKRKRGRPQSNGAQRPEALFRAMEALYIYHKIRKSGEKHSSAVFETAQALKGKYRVSETVVKRILAEWQGTGSRMAFTVSELAANEERLLDGRKARCVLALGIGPRPNYPRFNARQR